MFEQEDNGGAISIMALLVILAIGIAMVITIVQFADEIDATAYVTANK